MASDSGNLPAAKETARDPSSTSEDCGELAEDAGSVISVWVYGGAAEDDVGVGRALSADRL